MIHVTCAIERNYLAHCAAMLHSVFANVSEPVHVHLLHPPHFGRRKPRRLGQMVEALGGSISFIEVPDTLVEGMPTKGFTGKATWYRIFLADLLPDVDRVLHLDADLLALDSLDELWATDLGQHHLGAVTNVIMDHHAHRPASLGLAGPEVYFNAGVLLMGLERIRSDGQTAALREYAVRQGHRLEWRDQDALNVILGANRLALHPRWNCMNAVLGVESPASVFDPTQLAEARAHPAIRHFEGPGANKPWHWACTERDRERYFESRAATPWPRVRLEGRPRTVAPWRRPAPVRA